MLNLFSKIKNRKFTHQYPGGHLRQPRPTLVVTRTRRRIRLDRSGRPVELREQSTRVELSLPSALAGARAWLVEKISLFKIGFAFTQTAASALWGMGGLA